jgi:hypothetical protein
MSFGCTEVTVGAAPSTENVSPFGLGLLSPEAVVTWTSPDATAVRSPAGIVAVAVVGLEDWMLSISYPFHVILVAPFRFAPVIVIGVDTELIGTAVGLTPVTVGRSSFNTLN